MVRHAHARKVSVQLGQVGDKILVTIEDDGVGFDQNEAARKTGGEAGFGLFSIQERMSDLGGDFTIESQPGQGTKAFLSIPFNDQ